MFIEASQNEVENMMNIRLKKQIYVEELQFSNNEWMNWGYIKTTMPIKCPFQLEGYLNSVKQVSYPKEWLTVKSSNDDKNLHRNLYIVPVGSQLTQTQNAVYSGILPQLGFLGQKSIPYYWTVKYITGFEKVPADIANVIGKLTALNLFNIANDLILGTPGIGSKSVSLDGLSQSLSSSSGFNTRVKNYIDDMIRSSNALQSVYKGLSWGAV